MRTRRRWGSRERPQRTAMIRYWLVLLLFVTIGGCQDSGSPGAGHPLKTPEDTAAEPSPISTPEAKATPDNRWVTERPSWLGKRVLPLRPDGFGEVQPTPKVLRNRRFATIDLLPPPRSKRFRATITGVPPSVEKRSSWEPGCPVGLDELAYVTMPFWGFDRQLHMGEMIVNESVAEQVVNAFEVLHEARFAIEEMRVVTREEVDSWHTAPTGDVNVTSSFECREAAQSSHWSQHAYGLAIDINPFHNPYVRGDLVAPELASAYVDRSWRRPGMIFEGDRVTRAFDAIGWGWGGRWTSLKDWMHFSQEGN